MIALKLPLFNYVINNEALSACNSYNTVSETHERAGVYGSYWQISRLFVNMFPPLLQAKSGPCPHPAPADSQSCCF